MRLDAFDYFLPPEQIAQRPEAQRTASRLLVVDGSGDEATETRFSRLPSLLRPGDLLVMNRSRVLPARLELARASGGRVEALAVGLPDGPGFDAWVRPMKRLREGEVLQAEGGARVRFDGVSNGRAAHLTVLGPDETALDLLERVGHVPLPPYIRRADAELDRDRYQTVYAREPGSSAAPTAGLHFDADLLASLVVAGVETGSVVLHVGPGTFAPLEDEEVERNTLHGEYVEVDADLVEAWQRTRNGGGRIVAVGTTVVRTLETAARRGWLSGRPARHAGTTDLFIYPGFRFEAVDALLTNFHLPRSSLLLLVCAFGGCGRVLAAYRRAVEDGFRFFSYGDAMFLVPGVDDVSSRPGGA